MRIRIVTAAPPGSRHGNRGTALRWRRILEQLGHQVTIRQGFHKGAADLLVALHARRCAPSVLQFHQRQPHRPIIVALTGTDLYGDIPDGDGDALQSLELAKRILVLHEPPEGLLTKAAVKKVRVVYQSAQPPQVPPNPRRDRFEICVVGHLRDVKDPFLTARAVVDLPEDSKISVLHMGMAMTPEMARQARACESANPRYRWLGDLPRGRTLRTMARCRLMVISSKAEGGPTVLTEALAMQMPVLATKIDGIAGMIGEDFPGYFSVGDDDALRDLLLRAEANEEFVNELRIAIRAKSHLADPKRELAAWRNLLAEL